MSTPANSRQAKRRPQAEAVTPALLRAWPLPDGGSGKDDRGSVLVIGGARKTPGAALLAGVAALRAGAGRLTLAVAESVAVPLAIALPEAGVLGLPETTAGTVVGSAAGSLAAELETADAVLVGPGLDDKDQTTALLRELLQATPGSPPCIVLDAFALASVPELEAELAPWAGRLILTPNITEAGILLGREVEDLHRQLPEVADKYRAVVTCQGAIAEPRSTAGLPRPGPASGRSPQGTAGWAPRAAGMSSPAPSPASAPGERATRRPPAGERICMLRPETALPAGWAGWAISPGSSPTNCRHS